MSASNRKQILILSFILVVVTLGFGLVIPIFPFYIEELGAGGSELGLLVATSALLEFVFAPLWGSVSDRIGRKPVLILGMVGYGLSSFLMGLATQLWMLFASRALSGILSSATLTTALAYVGDSTSEEERGGGMGTLGAAMALGIILGPGLGGWLASNSLSTPFFVAAGMSLLSLVLILLLLPESLPAEARQRGKGKISTVSLHTLWRALFSPIGILLLMVALFSFALTNFEAVFGLYALEKFGYGPERVGTILMVVAVVSTVGKAALTGPATKRWGEATVIKVSALLGSVGFLVLLAANTYVTILLATGFFILSKTLLRPAAFALISKRSAASQGAAMGLSSSFMSLGRIAGPIWAGFIFDVNVNYPYLSGAVIMFIGFLASLFWVAQTRILNQEKSGLVY
ncbi:MAG: MFS transporter [Anaerolineae bacterium]|jgi:DHA1 family multidrug resistance protein-like MFS transporter